MSSQLNQSLFNGLHGGYWLLRPPNRPQFETSSDLLLLNQTSPPDVLHRFIYGAAQNYNQLISVEWREHARPVIESLQISEERNV